MNRSCRFPNEIRVPWLLLARTTPCFLLLTSTQLVAATDKATTRSEVRAFVQSHWQHGAPFDQSQDLGSTSLPTLYEIIRDQSNRQYWSNAVFAIGAIGDTASFDTLRSFVWDRFTGETGLINSRTLMVAQAAIGNISSKSPRALQYLERTSRPEMWRAIPWRFESKSDISRVMAEMAIQGLSLSASPEAGRALQRLRRELPAGIKPEFVDEAIATNGRVVTLGLREFMRRSQGEMR